MFSGITKDNHHHAYILEGERKAVLPLLYTFLEGEIGVKTKGNPNLHVWEADTLSIDEAREVREKERATAFGGGKKVFVIAAHAIGHEAQNALLKTLEEPRGDTMIFLVVPTREMLLPTVCSRAVFLRGAHSDLLEAGDEARRFVSLGMTERMEVVAQIIQEKDKDRAKRFLDALTVEYQKNVTRDSEYLEEILKAKRYLFDRAPSIKILLEYLALTFPEKSPKSGS